MKTLPTIAALCVLLSACGTLPSLPVTNVYCSVSGPCRVPVSVANCAVSAPNIGVSGAVNVYWEIDERSRAFQFPEDSLKSPGIWIEDDDANNPQFIDAARINSYQYQQRDRYINRKSYKYGIRVVRADGSACPIVKATIFNREPY